MCRPFVDPQRLPSGASLVVAFIEVDCSAPRLLQVIATLAADPHVFNLGHFTGPSDLLVTACSTTTSRWPAMWVHA